MSKFCPVAPKRAKEKPSLLKIFFKKRHSWLDGLYERSYHMKMGEVNLPGRPLYMVNEPALVKKILVDDAENFPKHKLLGDALEPLLGESIFTTNGALWKKQRRMMDKSFEQTRLKLVFSLMNEAADDMVHRINQLEDGVDQNIDLEMTHVTADVIFRTILSVSLESDDAKKIFEAFTRFQALVPRLMMPIIYRLPKFMHSWVATIKAKHAAKIIRGVLERFIRPRYEAFHQGNPGEYQDILSSLLEAKDPDTGESFTFNELVDQVAMLFLAGHETSASALAWTIYLIANTPDIQERMHKEVVDVIGDKTPEFRDMKNMELIRNVFKEALRLYPPVGFFARQATVKQKMRKKEVLPGASIIIAPWLIQRHEDLWDRPNEFDPDRYETESAKASLKCAYLPFGMGPRVCMGAAFALQEANLILATLVRKYRFEPVSNKTPCPVGRLTIRSENGVHVIIYKRNQENNTSSVNKETA